MIFDVIFFCVLEAGYLPLSEILVSSEVSHSLVQLARYRLAEKPGLYCLS